MGSKLISDLKAIVAKYPFPQAHKMLACLILAMLKIRHCPSYMLESISASALVKTQIIKAIRDLGDESQTDFEFEMFEITQSVATFSGLTEAEAAEITEYCKTIIPSNGDSLESFLRSNLSVAIEPSHIPIYFPGDNMAVHSAMLETVHGFYSERFVLRPVKRISDADLVLAITNYHESRGYVLAENDDCSVLMEKGDELISIVFSNYGGSIHVTAENIG